MFVSFQDVGDRRIEEEEDDVESIDVMGRGFSMLIRMLSVCLCAGAGAGAADVRAVVQIHK